MQQLNPAPKDVKEYHDKQSLLDVAKKMLEEERKKFYDKLFENG